MNIIASIIITIISAFLLIGTGCLILIILNPPKKHGTPRVGGNTRADGSPV